MGGLEKIVRYFPSSLFLFLDYRQIFGKSKRESPKQMFEEISNILKSVRK